VVMAALREEREPTSVEQMEADLGALKQASAVRERLPRNTPAWHKAVEAEQRAIERVRGWTSRSWR